MLTIEPVLRLQGVKVILIVPKNIQLCTKLKIEDNVQIIRERGTGIYSAFNDGLEAVDTKFVMFCGAGDLIFVDTVLAAIRIHESADIIMGNVLTDFRLRRPRRDVNRIPIGLDGLFTSHSVGIVFNTNFHKQLGAYDLDFRYCSDYDVFIRAINASKNIKTIDKIFGYWPFDGFSSSIVGSHKALEHFRIRVKNKLPNKYILYFYDLWKFTVLIWFKSILKKGLKV